MDGNEMVVVGISISIRNRVEYVDVLHESLKVELLKFELKRLK